MQMAKKQPASSSEKNEENGNGDQELNLSCKGWTRYSRSCQQPMDRRTTVLIPRQIIPIPRDGVPKWRWSHEPTNGKGYFNWEGSLVLHGRIRLFSFYSPLIFFYRFSQLNQFMS